MAELPEITKIAKQMNDTLKGKSIKELELLQDKCLNISVHEFQKRVVGAAITSITHKGKWIITALDNDEYILLSFGMGADVLYFENKDKEFDKYQVKVLFTDDSGYTARFWWFGHFLLAHKDELDNEPKTKDIAIDPFDEEFTYDYFASLLKGKRTQVKSFLMNQKNVGGIGNMYMHDILFKAGQHPKRKISDMSEGDIRKLYDSILEVLNLSKSKGGSNYEMDFFGKEGDLGMEDLLVGYKEDDEPCPVCSKPITFIKTGSTSSYICAACQKL